VIQALHSGCAVQRAWHSSSDWTGGPYHGPLKSGGAQQLENVPLTMSRPLKISQVSVVEYTNAKSKAWIMFVILLNAKKEM